MSYGQVGLLIGLPLLAGGLLELPFGLVAGHGTRRHRLVLAGGVVFLASLVAVAAAQSFVVLLLAFVAFFPASGAFVSLTQAALMDVDPGRQQQAMAAWNLAGSSGAVAGPLLLAGVLAAGGTWRGGYLALAAAAGVALVAAALAGPAKSAGTGRPPVPEAGETASAQGSTGVGAALRALRTGDTARWLVLLQVSDLLLDVLTGFVGVYLVDIARASPAQAAVGVAIRLGAGLLGDAVFVLAAGRVSPRAALRVSAMAAGLLFPAFLIAPWLPAKLVILAVLSIATACWYPLAQAGLYASVPGRSGIAVFLSSAAGLAGAIGPLAAGFAAERVGLTPALACLAVTPVVIYFLS